MDRAERARALADFRAGEAAVLVMDSSGAVGLDLSFVQHVFLMEPLGDLSMEQQIISRAHRLGASAAVHVEVLVMQVLSASLASCPYTCVVRAAAVTSACSSCVHMCPFWLSASLVACWANTSIRRVPLPWQCARSCTKESVAAGHGRG